MGFVIAIMVIILLVALLPKGDGNRNTQVNTSPVKASASTHIQQGKTRVNIDTFLSQYMKGAVMNQDLFVYLQRQKLNGEKYVYIDESVIKELQKKAEEYKYKETQLLKTAASNNKGMEYEKAGNIEDAISVYENNISGDCYPACHSFDRLMILYRKQKRYDDEIRVIEKAIEILSPRYPDLKPKYEQRLQKAKQLSEKIK